MMETVLHVAFGILTLAIGIALVRLVRGPSVLDRIMAFDLITTSSVGMIVLLSILWSTPHYLELILVFSLLGFFGTVAFVQYLSRPGTMEHEMANEDRPRGAEKSAPRTRTGDTDHV
jgi:multisubunit Na+/H+ antiporter MnhF subunit